MTRLLLPVTLSLGLVGYAHAAPGWQEWHQTGNDLVVSVSPQGKARIEHHVRYRVVAGKFTSFDLPAIDIDAAIAPEVSVVTDDGTRLTAHAEGISAKATRDDPDVDPRTQQVVRVSMDDARGLKRGTYSFTVVYEEDALTTGHLVKDGALWRLSWSLPASAEGRDGVRAVFQLPPAPTEPRAADRDDGAPETVMATLRRSPSSDELELVRAHVSRGEILTWAVRVDPKAFSSPALAGLRAAPSPKEPSRARDAILAVGLLAASFVLGALVAVKERALRAAAARAGLAPRPLVRLPSALRPPAVALLVAGGACVQVTTSPLLGTLPLLLATLLLVHLRPLRAGARARGPGRWTPLEERNISYRSQDRLRWLDATTGPGLATLALVAAVGLGLGSLAEVGFPGARVLLTIDALAVLPLFVTGTSAQLPPDGVRSAARFLGPLARSLARRSRLKSELLGRLPAGSSAPDEVRLRVLPQVAVPGLLALEVGLAPVGTFTGFVEVPELLVRSRDGSHAHARLSSLRDVGDGGPRTTLTGRSPEERVVRFVPESPTSRCIEILLRRLAAELTDRRRSLDASSPRGNERRAPPKNAKDTPNAALAT